jgi:subtilisin family serine protease
MGSMRNTVGVLAVVTATSFCAGVACDAPSLALSPEGSHAQSTANPEGLGYIVEAISSTAARNAVVSAGGEVTSDLPIIEAVAARLTHAQRTALAQDRQLRIVPDSQVRLAAASVTAAPTSNVRDNFQTASWNNNDGDHLWATPWVETGDDGQPATGNIAIQPVVIAGLVGAGTLSLKGHGGALTRRAALPPGALHATLSFNAQRHSLQAGDFISVQVSKDGGVSWLEVGRVQGAGSDSAQQPLSFDLANFISADTTIRLATNLSTSVVTGLLAPPTVNINSLQITYDSVYATGTAYPQTVSADRLHARGVTGTLVTIAVVDTGYWKNSVVDSNSLGLGRVLAQYDARTGVVTPHLLGLGSTSTDDSGHGSHITAIMLNTQKTTDGRYFGIAPDANLVSVKAFDANGQGTYSSVIGGIGWVVQNKALYGIRVLNLSFGAQPQSRYWEDPLNQAVMKAWQAGIVRRLRPRAMCHTSSLSERGVTTSRPTIWLTIISPRSRPPAPPLRAS